MSAQRLLKGKPGTLSVTLVDSNGDPVDASGAVTVGVVSESGVTIVPFGTAATSGSAVGVYTLAVSATQTAQLDSWTATWTDAGNGATQSTDHEVCGGFFFSVTEARNSDASLTDTSKYPDATILATRQMIEEECEFICDVPFVPRYRRVLLDGTAEPEIYLPDSMIRTVRSALILTALSTGGAAIIDPLVTSVTSTPTAFTVVFAQAHSLAVGDQFIMAGFSPNAYNGIWVVASVPTASSITVASPINPGTATVIGTTVGATGSVVVLSPGQLSAIVIDDNFEIQRNDGGIWDEGRRNVIIEYECGWDAPPAELTAASLLRLRTVLNRSKSTVPDRATSFVTEGGTTFRLDLPEAFKTGIPEVDAVYGRYSTRQFGDGAKLPASHSMQFDPSWYSVYHGGRR